MALSEDVSYVVLYKSRPLLLHGYIFPFIILYALLLVGWIVVFEGFEHVEAFFICVAAIGVLDVVTCLFCVWSVHVRCLLTCNRVSSLSEASLVKVVPTPNNGFTELLSLERETDVDNGQERVSFTFQKVKYIYDREEKKLFQPVEFPVHLSGSHYLGHVGLSSDDSLTTAMQKYGPNKLDVSSPEFWSLFKERATAPFFVFQVFCVGLWCLDEYWYYSLFTLVMLVLFEALLVQQQKRNLAEVRKMGSSPYLMWAYRCGKWTKILSTQLLPGDIVSIGRSKEGEVIPCDILLLRGSCIVDESMLTGESVPQMKEPLESPAFADKDVLNIQRDGRLHVLFGGTRVVQHTTPSHTGAIQKSPDKGCIGFILRTGFNTSQGKLLRTILYGVKRVTANNLETFLFILFLLVFAIMAAVYVWVNGVESPDRNRYKLFLECTLILTSVVPPELPIELSLAVNTSLISLTKIGIYCTEPFRIPFGGKVDVCCFDKTGTLTSNTLVVQGIAGLPSGSSDNEKDLVAAYVAPFETQCVLASCQSLAMLDGELVGDPLEMATLKAVEWKISKSDTVTPCKGRKCQLVLQHRFHFSSALKRMSTVSFLTDASSSYIVAVKGAPEVLKEMFSEIPENYESVYLKLARKGSRVLALGYRNMGKLSMRQVSDLKRGDVERELKFVGFVAIACPLRKDSKECVRELKESSHHVVMITGDNPLTACYVAKELGIAPRKRLVLTPPPPLPTSSHAVDSINVWKWQSINTATSFAFGTDRKEISKLGSTYDLCLTGEGIAHLQSLDLFWAVLPFVKVFARVSPGQKETIITTYKSLGYHTLMCGDGTNDVGALKHAHVGVSLLSTVRIKPGSDTAGKDRVSSTGNKNELQTQKLTRSPLRPTREQKGSNAVVVTPSRGQAKSRQHQSDHRTRALQDLIKQAEDNMKDPALVRLGDASIASPFTSREASIRCTCHVIKQGRCTLVTTLQMFKILALNALILAYSQSVLYLDGIKFSDLQATIQGFLLAGCFLFISRAKPLQELSPKRPLPNIFNIYTILTVLSQFVVHFVSLVYLVREAKAISPPTDGFVDLEKEFEENVLNSAVYLISLAMQISNFAVNYKGHPFMMSLHHNKPLLYSLVVSVVVLFLLASGVFPPLSASLEIVTFPQEFQRKLLLVLLGDMLCSAACDQVLSFFLGTAKLRKPG